MSTLIRSFQDAFDNTKRSAALWAVGLSIFSYFIFIAHHLIGNHALRLPWLHANDQIANGRWLSPYLGHLHYNADVPVVMPVFGISLAALAAIIAIANWRLSRTRLEHFVIVAVILVFPMNLAAFYYSFMTPLFFIANVFAALAAFVLDRWSIWRILAGAVCVLLTLASYQAAISIFGILTFAGPIACFLLATERGEKPAIKAQTLVFAARILGAALGGAGYLLSLKLFKVSSSQSLEIGSLAELFERIRVVAGAAFNHLLITQPDMLAPLKMALLTVLVIAVLASMVYLRRSPLAAMLTLALWIGMILSTKAVFLISDPTGSIYEYRYNLGISFLHAFSFGVLLFAVRKNSWVRNGFLMVTAIIMMTMVQANLVRQNVLLRGQSHDLAIANRVLSRIEQLDGFDPARTYDLIRIGQYSSFRYNLFRSGRWKIDRAGDGHMDFGEITDRWVDEDVFRLLGARIRFQQTSTDPRYSAKYAEIVESGILDDHEPWPAASSVFITGDRIIVLMQKPARPKGPVRDIDIQASEAIEAEFSEDAWRSTGGTHSNLQITKSAISLAAGQGGISAAALSVQPGDRFRLSFEGSILDRGNNGVSLSFAVGPVFLDAEGKVVGWWNSDFGRDAVKGAAEDQSFVSQREAVAPAQAVSAHIAFHGPYSPDGNPSNGRVQITGAKLERIPAQPE